VYPIPPTETLAETKTCKHCGAFFPITDQDLEFYDKLSPVFAGVKFSIPAPTLCPDCRQQRRVSFRNARKVYKRNCDATKKTIVSVFSQDKPYKVYDSKMWFSDIWNPLDYGRDFDFSRSFFDQFNELFLEIPHQSRFDVNTENCDYAQLIGSKNCYLTFVGGFSENLLYSYWMVKTRDCVDCMRCQDIEECYDCEFCYQGSHGLISCSQCNSCTNCSFCWNLTNCQDCFLSGNLTGKKYVFKNEPLTRESYEEKVRDFWKTHNFDAMKLEKTRRMTESFFRVNQNFGSENCTGDYVKNSKNCFGCYEVITNEDCRYFYDNAGDCHDCMDASYGLGGRNCYEILGADGSRNLFGMMNVLGTNDSIYSYACYDSHHIFGCAGLKNASYCILNKQYTKEQYEELVPKIIEHMRGTLEWGEFFPSSMSPFGYNETVAQEYYPMTREQALGVGAEDAPDGTGRSSGPRLVLGQRPAEAFVPDSVRSRPSFNWSDYEPPFPKVEKTIPASKLPTDITQVPDDILNWAIECEVTKKPFRIIKQELEFYRKHRLPIPKRHPDQRQLERIRLQNPRSLFERVCDCPDCAKNHAAPDGKPTKFLTTYAPERSEKVYCEKCYDSEVA
jgi:hypothetical protein